MEYGHWIMILSSMTWLLVYPSKVQMLWKMHMQWKTFYPSLKGISDHFDDDQHLNETQYDGHINATQDDSMVAVEATMEGVGTHQKHT